MCPSLARCREDPHEKSYFSAMLFYTGSRVGSDLLDLARAVGSRNSTWAGELTGPGTGRTPELASQRAGSGRATCTRSSRDSARAGGSTSPGTDRFWSQPLRRQALDPTRVQKTLGSLPVNRSRGPGANSTYSRTSGPAPSGLAPGKPCGRRCASSWHPLSFHPVAHATPLRASLAQRATC